MGVKKHLDKAHGSRSGAGALAGPKAPQLPTRVDVQLATLAKEAPEGDQWLHEIKLDGYRMICRLVKGRVEFISRNHQDWTKRLSALAEEAARLAAKQAILDGEVVAARPDGTTSFQDLQNAFRDRGQEKLRYYAFDLLHLDGHELTGLPLEERKRVLGELLTKSDLTNIQLSEHIEGRGPAFLKEACKMRLEGIISKRRDRPYQPGRGYDWLKVKCVNTNEFVIGGYTEPTGARAGFGALLVGHHNRRGDLVYAGKVGTGFNERMLRSLLDQLKPLARPDSPFTNLKRAGVKTHWVKPKLVAQVVFGAWTNDGLLRHASFQGLREDKPARQVTQEKAVPLASAVRRGRRDRSEDGET